MEGTWKEWHVQKDLEESHDQWVRWSDPSVHPFVRVKNSMNYSSHITEGMSITDDG